MCLGGGGGGSRAAADAERRERERQEKIASTIAVINRSFDDPSRAQVVDELRQSVEEQNRAELDREKREAERALTFDLARRGLAGGSQEVFDRGRVLELFNRGVADVSTFADDRAAALRAADERARQALIRDAQVGLDQHTATQSALNALNLNLEGVRGGTRLASIGDLFADIARGAEVAAQRKGIARARPFEETFLAVPPVSRSFSGSQTAIG